MPDSCSPHCPHIRSLDREIPVRDEHRGGDK